MKTGHEGRNTYRRQIIIMGILLLLAGCFAFFYWAERKEIWFCDEIYTYESSNGFEQNWPASNPDQWMSGADVEDFFSADADGLMFHEIRDRLYCDHVPLYFWIFRMVSLWFFPGSGSVWIGLSINLVLYGVVLLIVYGIFLYLVKNPAISGIATVAVCVVNRLMIQQAMTIRMYLMLVWAELLLLVCGFYVLHEAQTKEKVSIRAFLALYAVSLTGFLTHYDFWIFYAAAAAAACLYLLFRAVQKGRKYFWKTTQFRNVIAWVGNFAVSLLSTIAVFPYCRWNLNRGKGQIALHSVIDFSPEKLQHILWGYRRLSMAILGEWIPVPLGLLILFGCIFAAAVLLWRKKEYEKFSWLLITVAISQLYQFAVCFTMPDVEEERYLWGSFSILVICVCWGAVLLIQWGVSHIGRIALRRTVQYVLAAVVTLGFLWMQWIAMDHGNGVTYLFYPGKDVEQLKAHSDIPWLVYGPLGGVYSYYDWLIPDRICFLSCDNTAEDAEALKEIAGEDEILLYVMDVYYPYALEFLEQELGRTFAGEYLFDSTNLSVYVLRTQ